MSLQSAADCPTYQASGPEPAYILLSPTHLDIMVGTTGELCVVVSPKQTTDLVVEVYGSLDALGGGTHPTTTVIASNQSAVLYPIQVGQFRAGPVGVTACPLGGGATGGGVCSQATVDVVGRPGDPVGCSVGTSGAASAFLAAALLAVALVFRRLSRRPSRCRRC